MKRSNFIYHFFGVGVIFLLLTFGVFIGCQKTDSPLGIYAPQGLDRPTQTPIARLTGPVMVSVADKSAAVTGLTVLAIPPSGSTTFSQATTTTGIATFNPPYLEVGNWTFIVPAQTPYPFAPSTITMGVSLINQTAAFASAPATIQLTPPVPSVITGTSGGQFIYGMNYIQPGNLWVPVTIKISALNSGWSGGYSPTTIGFSGSDSGFVTVTGGGCVDKAQSFAVTAFDFSAVPYFRGNSAPQTVTKSFTTTVTVSWSSPNFSNVSNCNIEKSSNAGSLVISATNGCTTVDVWVNEPSTNCTQGSWNTPNGNTNCNGGHITFSPGTYSCQYISDGGFPTFHAQVNSSGQQGSLTVGNGSGQVVLNASY
jgi:hypothetical protein